MTFKFSESSYKDFLNHYQNDDLIFYQPTTKKRCLDIDQSTFDTYTSEFIIFLNTHESEVYSEIINPFLYKSYQIDTSGLKSLIFHIVSKNGWKISSNYGNFTLNIPNETINRYAKLHLTYPHNISICFYMYILKSIFRKKYNLQDYYEYKGPWNMIDGGKGYVITLYYK